MKHRWQYHGGLPANVLACECSAERQHRAGDWRTAIVYRMPGGEWVATVPACTRQPAGEQRREGSAGR